MRADLVTLGGALPDAQSARAEPVQRQVGLIHTGLGRAAARDVGDREIVAVEGGEPAHGTMQLTVDVETCEAAVADELNELERVDIAAAKTAASVMPTKPIGR